jgi:signal peptidase I
MEEEKRGDRMAKVALDWIKTIIIAIIIALPVRWFIAEPFLVSGPSMYPTFHTGEFLIVDRVSYKLHEPKRGDVIVFRYPNNPSTYYIKRIMGLPNEKVSIREGKLSITDKDGKDQDIGQPFVNEANATHEDFETTLGSHEYFVMGDNRLNSSDSRTWGNLDEKFIIGKAFIRLFPFSKIDLKPGQYTYEK